MTKPVDINSMYPTIFTTSVFGKYDSEKWIKADRELKENLFQKYRNRVIRKMTLEEVLQLIEKEVKLHVKHDIQGFTLGMAHVRTLINERMLDK